jgi:uncharacterized Zn finger protein
MNWDPSWPRSGPKKPPPEHGIKIKKAGTTWWGQRWIEALEQVLRGDSGRLARGRTYARAGRTHDLQVENGKVSAAVTGSRSTPYAITIELAQLSNAAWQQAIAGMAAKAQFSAELLASQMPKAIDEVFLAAGSSLFPRVRADLKTDCSCPDWGDPCKHIAATHYVLGEALDRDPFLLFELRGRSKERVLDELRRARGGAGAPLDVRDEAPEISKLALSRVDAADYDTPRDTLPALNFSFDAPEAHGALLRQLGTPAAWSGEGSPANELAAQIHAAAEVARKIALAESAAGPDDRPVPTPRNASPTERATGDQSPTAASPNLKRQRASAKKSKTRRR